MPIHLALLPLSSLVSATSLAYLLLIEWTGQIADSVVEAYGELPEGFSNQIALDAIGWLGISAAVLGFQLLWTWRQAARRKRAEESRFGIQLARSLLVVIGTTAVSSFVLWAHVDLALLRLGHESVPSFLVGWFILGGLLALLAWAVVALFDVIRTLARRKT